MNENPAVEWIPEWLVDVGKSCEVGIAIDDSCFVVLVKSWAGQWLPATHIPPRAAEEMGKLAAERANRYKAATT